MKNQKIADDMAEQMLSEWEDDTGATLAKELRPGILKALKEGRLSYSGGAFEYQLRTPVEMAGGTTISTLSLKEPKGGQIRDVLKGNRDDFDVSCRLVGLSSGQPIAVIDALGQRDLTVLGGLLGFFG